MSFRASRRAGHSRVRDGSRRRRHAADGTPSAAERYRAERAVCLSGESNQSRSTCLQEAQAAYAQMRKGGGWTADPSDFDDNLVARCDPLPDLEQRACIARMQGAGTTSGSVAEGGIFRQLVITVPPDADNTR